MGGEWCREVEWEENVQRSRMRSRMGVECE